MNATIREISGQGGLAMCVKVKQLGNGQAPEREKEMCKGKGWFLFSLPYSFLYFPFQSPLSSFPPLFNQAPRIHKALHYKDKDL